MSHNCRPCDNYSVVCDPGCTATRPANHGNVCNDSPPNPDVNSNKFYNNCLNPAADWREAGHVVPKGASNVDTSSFVPKIDLGLPKFGGSKEPLHCKRYRISKRRNRSRLINGRRSNRKGSNKKRSNRKRSYRKKSNRRRSNRKRSNRKRSNKKRSKSKRSNRK